jgi:hypothetical protein
MARDCIRVEKGVHYLRASEAGAIGGNEAESGKANPMELQKIRRELLALSDRAVKLAARLDVLITQQGQEIA